MVKNISVAAFSTKPNFILTIDETKHTPKNTINTPIYFPLNILRFVKRSQIISIADNPAKIYVIKWESTMNSKITTFLRIQTIINAHINVILEKLKILVLNVFVFSKNHSPNINIFFKISIVSSITNPEPFSDSAYSIRFISFSDKFVILNAQL